MRNSSTALSLQVFLVAVALLAHPATAIERYVFEPLPDDGFGSSALACNAGDHATGSDVVGMMTAAFGRELWSLRTSKAATGATG